MTTPFAIFSAWCWQRIRAALESFAVCRGLAIAPAGIRILPAGAARDCSILNKLAYHDFRKLLYDSTLNQELSAFDAEVTLFQLQR